MKPTITQSEIAREIRIALKHIRQNAKKTGHKVTCLDRDYRYFPHETYLTVQIAYWLDNVEAMQVYNIAL